MIVATYIAHKLRAEFLSQRFLNSTVPKYFFENIYYQYKDQSPPELFVLCTRAIGNLVLKILWIYFIQAEVFFLETERREEAIHFE